MDDIDSYIDNGDINYKNLFHKKLKSRFWIVS